MIIRTLLLLMLLVTASGSIRAAAIRLSEPVQNDDISETFGAPLAELPMSVELTSLLQAPDSYLATPFTVKVRVTKVCQKKGCFFIAQQGKSSVRVAFKDYGFFVPTDIAGREVTLVGQLIAREVSLKQAQHFSKDLGEKGGVQSGLLYEIVASSVRVPFN